MADLKDLLALKERVESLRREADKAAGALEQSMRRLKEEFGCGSIKEAEKLLKELKAEEEESKDQFDREFEKFEKLWSE